MPLARTSYQPILRDSAASKSLHSIGISHQPKYFGRHVVVEFDQFANPRQRVEGQAAAAFRR
jgi:hypothetical protein